MRADGPELQRGWRVRIDVDGVTAVVEARHFARNRMPTFHEIARQATRGTTFGFQMVQEPAHEWAVLLQEGAMGQCTIRPTPSGQFEIAGTRRVHRSIEEAVRAWAEPKVAQAAEARAMREGPMEKGGGPTP